MRSESHTTKCNHCQRRNGLITKEKVNSSMRNPHLHVSHMCDFIFKGSCRYAFLDVLHGVKGVGSCILTSCQPHRVTPGEGATVNDQGEGKSGRNSNHPSCLHLGRSEMYLFLDLNDPSAADDPLGTIMISSVEDLEHCCLCPLPPPPKKGGHYTITKNTWREEA